jgi:NAD(P)-dependent dehydrogenase (short-subunit alcohol dehydrogenase family)
MKNQTSLIIGANSEIAKALALFLVDDINTHLIVISRNVDFYRQDNFAQSKVIKVDDYQESTIKAAIEKLQQDNLPEIKKVFICQGLLHSKTLQPEKRLSAFSSDSFIEVLTANTIIPMLWLKNLMPIVSGKEECKIVVFSARVGSISDNEIGGWYSYRASKAGINMLLKTAAVELSRTAKNIKLISFHPGTTDTPLSKPFQKNVPEHKLFSSDFVASQLLQIVANAQVDGQASFLDWEGKQIPW